MKIDLIVKSVFVFFVILIFRLAKGSNFPNADVVIAGVMPFAQRGGKCAGFVLAACSILAFDLWTSALSIETAVNAATYGVIGIAAAAWFKGKEMSLGQRNGFSVFAILFFDLVTGPISQALFGYNTFAGAFALQTPFTLYHLGWGAIFVTLLTPAISRWIMDNRHVSWSVFRTARA